MNDKQEPKKKRTNSTDVPVHMLRAGCVVASIWQRQSPSGFSYLDFSLTREFTSLSSGSAGTSKNFFSRNQEELIAVVTQACRWIASQEQGDELEKSAAA